MKNPISILFLLLMTFQSWHVYAAHTKPKAKAGPPTPKGACYIRVQYPTPVMTADSLDDAAPIFCYPKLTKFECTKKASSRNNFSGLPLAVSFVAWKHKESCKDL